MATIPSATESGADGPAPGFHGRAGPSQRTIDSSEAGVDRLTVLVQGRTDSQVTDQASV